MAISSKHRFGPNITEETEEGDFFVSFTITSDKLFLRCCLANLAQNKLYKSILFIPEKGEFLFSSSSSSTVNYRTLTSSLKEKKNHLL